MYPTETEIDRAGWLRQRGVGLDGQSNELYEADGLNSEATECYMSCRDKLTASPCSCYSTLSSDTASRLDQRVRTGCSDVNMAYSGELADWHHAIARV